MAAEHLVVDQPQVLKTEARIEPSRADNGGGWIEYGSTSRYWEDKDETRIDGVSKGRADARQEQNERYVVSKRIRGPLSVVRC